MDDQYSYNHSGFPTLHGIGLAETAAPKEEVNHPDRYNAGGVECIAAIEAALTPEEYRGFIKGTVLRYAWREKHKGGDQDLAKARWYLDRLLATAPK